MRERREREDRDERIHQRVWELLPWHVNGSLSGREREKVEAHLAGCPRCQAEEAACRQAAEAVSGAGESAPSPHPAQFQRLLERVEEEERAQGGGWLAAVRSLLGATPRPLRGALVAQAAVILLLVGMVAWGPRRPLPAKPVTPAGPVVYRTLSDSAARPAHSVRLRLMFSPKSTEREIRDLLLGVHGEITAGPSPLGIYTVQVPVETPEGIPAGDPAKVLLARLHSEPQVVFAEPASDAPASGAR
jgi:hypothetical protein